MELIVKIFKDDRQLKNLSRLVTAEPVIKDNHKKLEVSCEHVGKMISNMLKEVNQSEHLNCMFSGCILITPEIENLGSKIELLFQEE